MSYSAHKCCTLETKRPNCARRIEVEHVEHVAEVEPRSLNLEFDVGGGKPRNAWDSLRLDTEALNGARACEIQLKARVDIA